MITCRCDVLRRAAVAAALGVIAAGAQAGPADDAEAFDALELPSGQPAELSEVVHDEEAGLLRLRILAPQISRDAEERIDPDAAFEDMQVICDEFGLDLMRREGVERLVVSMKASELALGETAPDVTQYFEAFRAGRAVCLWEEF